MTTHHLIPLESQPKVQYPKGIHLRGCLDGNSNNSIPHDRTTQQLKCREPMPGCPGCTLHLTPYKSIPTLWLPPQVCSTNFLMGYGFWKCQLRARNFENINHATSLFSFSLSLFRFGYWNKIDHFWNVQATDTLLSKSSADTQIIVSCRLVTGASALQL